MNENNDKEIKDIKLEPGLTPLNKEQVKKKLMALGVLVLIVVAGLFLITRELYVPPVVVEGCNPGDNFSQTTGQPCSGVISMEPCLEGEIFDKTTGEPCVGVVDPNATPETGSPTYQEALETYAGKKFLFDANCVSTPATLEAPIGSKIIIANNSKKTLAFSIQNKKANLLPYYYMVSTIESAGPFPVTCNGMEKATVTGV